MADKKKIIEELEVRGFLTTGCDQCPFVRQSTGGYQDMEVLGYYCGLYNKEFPNPDWDSKYMHGCKNSVPKGFPKFCRLKKVDDQSAMILQRYKRIIDELRIIKRIIND
jgi:hypothetical protein